MSHRQMTETSVRVPRLHTLVLPISGRRVTMARGDMLEIQMRQIVGSGSVWSVAQAPEGVAFERDEHLDPGPRAVGSFSTRLFQFRAVAAGIGVLRLSIGRPETAEPLGHIDLHLTVAP